MSSPFAYRGGRAYQRDIPPPVLHDVPFIPPDFNNAVALIHEPMSANAAILSFLRKPNVAKAAVKSKRPTAPPLDRSLSEPTSPVEATKMRNGYAADHEERKVDSGAGGDQEKDYVAEVSKLLDESRLRFDGHEREFTMFHRKYRRLLVNAPVHGKLVKKDRPKPTAQQSAKELLQEIMERLEQLDMEDADIPAPLESSVTEGRNQPNIHSTPSTQSGPPIPKTWLPPQDMRLPPPRSPPLLGPGGTWHNHSRSQSVTSPRPLPQFDAPERSKRVGNHERTMSDFQLAQGYHGKELSKDDLERDALRKERNKYRERELEEAWERGQREQHRDIRNGKSKEKERTSNQDYLNSQHYYRANSPLPQQQTSASHLQPPGRDRERQLSDPTTYTRRRRNSSPSSIPPAVFTLNEDVQVRDGTTTGVNRSVAVPRVPTVVDLSVSDDENNTGKTYWRREQSGNVAKEAKEGRKSEDRHRSRRKRSRSVELETIREAEKFQSKSRPRSPREREREKYRGRESESDRQRGREVDKRDGERDRGVDRERDWKWEKEGITNDGDMNPDRRKDRDRSAYRERDKNKDWNGDREQDRGKDRDKDRRREKERDRDRDREGEYKGGYRERVKDKPKEKDKERDRERAWDGHGHREYYKGSGREWFSDKDEERRRERRESHERERGDRRRDERQRTEQKPGSWKHRDQERYDGSYREKGSSDGSRRHMAPTRGLEIPLGYGNPSTAMHSGLPFTGNAIAMPSTQPDPVPSTGINTNLAVLPRTTNESRFVEILTSPVPTIPQTLLPR